jgi:hypothetical protein
LPPRPFCRRVFKSRSWLRIPSPKLCLAGPSLRSYWGQGLELEPRGQVEMMPHFLINLKVIPINLKGQQGSLRVPSLRRCGLFHADKPKH